MATASWCCVLVLTTVLFCLPRSRPIIAYAANQITFAPSVTKVADLILSKLPGKFNGAHLRIEPDFSIAFGNTPLSLFINAMKSFGYNSEAPVYVASGVFTSEDTSEQANVTGTLVINEVVSTVLHKKQFVPRGTLQGLTSEQLALIDLLVLSRADKVVGHCQSSFSWFLMEWRALHGLPRNTSHLIQVPRCAQTDAWKGSNRFEIFNGGFLFA
ncbi:MAG: hypothetical protein J3K34DRAFT_450571 [Monoraphidium minutum]|nr:MAG: hypothetical protein J3K34DRAFT_450571 [Monoraphidium minutum]